MNSVVSTIDIAQTTRSIQNIIERNIFSIVYWFIMLVINAYTNMKKTLKRKIYTNVLWSSANVV